MTGEGKTLTDTCSFEPAVKRQRNDIIQEFVMLNEVKHLVLLIVILDVNEIFGPSTPQNANGQEPALQNPFGFDHYLLRSVALHEKFREVISFLQRNQAPRWGSITSVLMLFRMQEVRARRDSYTSSPGLNPLLV